MLLQGAMMETCPSMGRFRPSPHDIPGPPCHLGTNNPIGIIPRTQGSTMSPKIYTRTGDQGETGLFLGPRVGKDMPRIEVIGTLDELNAVLGASRSGGLPGEIDAVVARVQNELFVLGAEIAAPNPGLLTIGRLQRQHVEALESEIDRFSEALPPLTDFILPGGTSSAAWLHLARTICRRAERRLVTLLREVPEEISLVLLAYLNRLADLLFVVARVVNRMADCPDVAWKKAD